MELCAILVAGSITPPHEVFGILRDSDERVENAICTARNSVIFWFVVISSHVKVAVDRPVFF